MQFIFPTPLFFLLFSFFLLSLCFSPPPPPLVVLHNNDEQRHLHATLLTWGLGGADADKGGDGMPTIKDMVDRQAVVSAVVASDHTHDKPDVPNASQVLSIAKPLVFVRGTRRRRRRRRGRGR